MMHTIKPIRQHNGFGLLEVLLATAIFIVVVGSMVTLSRLALRNAVLSGHRTQAFNLAQEGLESVRQMRDTNWIDSVPKVRGSFRSDETNEWKAFVHECSNTSERGRAASYSAPVIGKIYAICYDDAMPAGEPGRFGLKETNANVQDTRDTDANITVTDPNGPLSFHRTITFENIPDTDSAYNGLQMMVERDNNPALLVAPGAQGVERLQSIKVISTVQWRDFDKTWNVTLTTILTNWQKK
jgi:Tfp pilus assembly protein PilV